MKLSIRWALIAGAILLVWCTHLILGPTSYFMTKRALKTQMQKIMKDVSFIALQQSHHYLSKAETAAAIDMQLLGSNVVSSQIEETSALERYFFDQLHLNPHLSSIYVGALNGNFFMVKRNAEIIPDGFQTTIIRNEKGGRTTKHIWRDNNYMLFHYVEDPTDTYDPRMQLWFAEGLAFEHLVWTEPYILPNTNKPGITYTGQVTDRNDGIVGVVGVDIELSDLSEFIKNIRVGQSGKAIIINQNHDIIAIDGINKYITLSEDENIFKLPTVDTIPNDIIKKAFQAVDWKFDDKGNLALENSISSDFKHDNEKFLVMFTPFSEPGLPWIIGVYLPENDYLGTIKSNQLFILLATIVISILATFLGYRLAKKITIPVVQLADAAKDVANQNISGPFHLETNFKEIQDTAEAFSRMKNSILDYEKRIQENEMIYRTITKSAQEAILLIDANNIITFVNPAAEELFQCSNQQMIGNKLSEHLASDKDRFLYVKAIDNLLQVEDENIKHRNVHTIIMNTVGQKIPVELSLSKLNIEGDLHAVAIIRNITERQKAALLRKRLVNDLHDGIGGNLSNIKLLADMSKMHNIPEQTAVNLRYIADISMDCITELRNYMDILDDTELSWKSFIAEMHQYCAKTLEPHHIKFSMPLEIAVDAPPPTTLLYMNIFKIVKEAINNVIKHSMCDTVTIDTQIKIKSAQWIIQDNGIGNVSSLHGGRGILSMSSRVKELGGIIKFSWSHGARITINIPFTQTTVREQMLQDEKIKNNEYHE